MGSTKIKTTKPEELEVTTNEKVVETPTEETAVKPKRERVRSKRYVWLRSQVDRTKTYPVEQALELVKKLSKKSHSTITADINCKDTLQVELTFPHSTGKTSRVGIVTDEILADIAKGVIEYDVLIASPAFMPKLAKHARVLGPKGLMPNPKNGTVTPDPEKKLKELSGGKVTVKTEKKSPLMHVQIGKIDQDTKELIANIETLVKVIGSGKITKITVSGTMTPGIKVDLASVTVIA